CIHSGSKQRDNPLRGRAFHLCQLSPLSLSHTHTHRDRHTHTHTFITTLSLSHTHTRTETDTHTHTFITSLSHTHTHTHALHPSQIPERVDPSYSYYYLSG